MFDVSEFHSSRNNKIVSELCLRVSSIGVLNKIVFLNIGLKLIKQHLAMILFYKNLSNNYMAQTLIF
jgi:hypothetical protein